MKKNPNTTVKYIVQYIGEQKNERAEGNNGLHYISLLYIIRIGLHNFLLIERKEAVARNLKLTYNIKGNTIN
jgi:hypothetical protein